jgi:hypothetical protein
MALMPMLVGREAMIVVVKCGKKGRERIPARRGSSPLV